MYVQPLDHIEVRVVRRSVHGAGRASLTVSAGSRAYGRGGQKTSVGTDILNWEKLKWRRVLNADRRVVLNVTTSTCT